MQTYGVLRVCSNAFNRPTRFQYPLLRLFLTTPASRPLHSICSVPTHTPTCVIRIPL